MSAPGAGPDAASSTRRTLWAGAGGVTAAFLSSLCCMGPLLFVTLGVGAGLASTFEPLRPVFAVVMLGMFAFAFYSVYGPRLRARSDGGSAIGDGCPVPRDRRREKVVLWVAALLALVLWTFPTWAQLLV